MIDTLLSILALLGVFAVIVWGNLLIVNYIVSPIVKYLGKFLPMQIRNYEENFIEFVKVLDIEKINDSEESLNLIKGKLKFSKLNFWIFSIVIFLANIYSATLLLDESIETLQPYFNRNFPLFIFLLVRILVLLVLMLIPLYLMSSSIMSTIKLQFEVSESKEISQNSIIRDLVDKVSKKTECKEPKIVKGSTLNGLPSVGVKLIGKDLLFIPFPFALYAKQNPLKAEAVLAHEFIHLKNRDLGFFKQFAAIYSRFYKHIGSTYFVLPLIVLIVSILSFINAVYFKEFLEIAYFVYLPTSYVVFVGATYGIIATSYASIYNYEDLADIYASRLGYGEYLKAAYADFRKKSSFNEASYSQNNIFKSLSIWKLPEIPNTYRSFNDRILLIEIFQKE